MSKIKIAKITYLNLKNQDINDDNNALGRISGFWTFRPKKSSAV